MKTTELDVAHMRAALSLAARGLGQVWPNPAVGCVLVDSKGHVIGRGYTQPGGRPHAETEALQQAGARAAGTTTYVTLEPCAHHGKTPPCVDALVKAGIRRCVVALQDPDPRVAGQGLTRLRQAGIEVTLGVLQEAAADLNAGFLKRVNHGRPLVSLKLATSLDGKIATSTGESKWITGPEARAFGHRLRATHDAILIGSGTVLADDPELNCRLPGLAGRSPVPIVLDRRGRFTGDAKLARGSSLHIITSSQSESELRKRFSNSGQHVEIISLREQTEVKEVLQVLGQRGFTRILVEGGATLATALLKAGLVDRFYWFRSSKIMGGDGLAGLGDLGIEKLSEAVRLRRKETRQLGDDVLELYVTAT